MKKPKVLVIVGPTASGKTSLSIQLAQKFNGEIISADSRQVYRGLDIGTGKVTKDEMQGIPHHLLDVADPKETYTVADFVRDSRNAIEEIQSRGKLPIIVGGTFLYVDSLLGKVSTPEVPPNPELRAQLETLSSKTLFLSLKEKDPERAQTIDAGNKRRLIRALEIIDAVGTVPKTEQQELYDALTIGISISREQLQENISKRLSERIENGMIEEVKSLYANGLSYERLAELGIEYKYTTDFLQNNITHDEMLKQIVTKSMQYAKRQMTWLKRNKSIQWFESGGSVGVEGVVEELLK